MSWGRVYNFLQRLKSGFALGGANGQRSAGASTNVRAGVDRREERAGGEWRSWRRYPVGTAMREEGRGRGSGAFAAALISSRLK